MTELKPEKILEQVDEPIVRLDGGKKIRDDIESAVAATDEELQKELEEKEKKRKMEEEGLQIIDEIFRKNYVERECEINKNLKVRFRTLTGEDNIKINEELSEYARKNQSVNMKIINAKQTIKILARAIVSINGMNLGNDPESFLESKSAVFLDILSNEYSKFEDKIKTLISQENILKNF